MDEVLALRPTLCEVDKMRKAPDALQRNRTKHAETRRKMIAILATTPGFMPSDELRAELGLTAQQFANVTRSGAPWLESIGRQNETNHGFDVSGEFMEMLGR